MLKFKNDIFVCYGDKWQQNNEYKNHKMTGIIFLVECTYNNLESMLFFVIKLIPAV